MTDTHGNPYGIELPPLSKAVIDTLDQQFPERCPRPQENERDIWMYAGKRSLVRWLLDQYERQQTAARKEGLLVEMPTFRPGGGIL